MRHGTVATAVEPALRRTPSESAAHCSGTRSESCLWQSRCSAEAGSPRITTSAVQSLLTRPLAPGPLTAAAAVPLAVPVCCDGLDPDSRRLGLGAERHVTDVSYYHTVVPSPSRCQRVFSLGQVSHLQILPCTLPVGTGTAARRAHGRLSSWTTVAGPDS